MFYLVFFLTVSPKFPLPILDRRASWKFIPAVELLQAAWKAAAAEDKWACGGNGGGLT